MHIPAWMTEMFEALDAGNIDRFCSYISDDGAFIFANMPPVEGRAAIYEFVAGFIGSIDHTEHSLDEVFAAPGRSVVRGQVKYVRDDGSTLSVPFANVFEMGDDGIDTYQIYVDNTEL